MIASFLCKYSLLTFFYIIVLLTFFTTNTQAHFSDFITDPDLYEFLQNDYYGCLGVSPHASARDIRKAYRVLSQQFHPDRNPDAPKQRFLDIAAANEALKNTEKRARYDKFLAEVPSQFRPRYGKRQVSPILVSIVAGTAIMVLVSVVQSQQFKRERIRALNSAFFEKAVATASKKGVSETTVLKSFLETNPELDRTWRDTVGWTLVLWPYRQFHSLNKKVVQILNSNKGVKIERDDEKSNSGKDSSDDDSSDDEEEAEEPILPNIPDDASPTEVKLVEKERRKILRRHAEKVQKARQEKKTARLKKQARKQRQKAFEQRKATQDARKRDKKMEEDKRVQELLLEKRIFFLSNTLCVESLFNIIADSKDDALGIILRSAGIITGNPAKPAELFSTFDAIKRKMLSMVSTSDLDEKSFWCDVFDHELVKWLEAERAKSDADQEAYDEESRQNSYVILDHEDAESYSGSVST